MSVVIDKFSEIEKLDEMRRMGLISEKDFELQKKVLLNQSTQSKNQQAVERYVVPKCSFIKANIWFWKRGLNWVGRSTRAEYWWSVLGLSLEILLLGFVCGMFMNEERMETVFNILNIIIFIPMLTLTIRRIHDTGRSAKFLLWPFIVFIVSLVLLIIPPIGVIGMILAGFVGFGVSIAVFIFSLLPSQPQKNIYDEDVFD